MNAPPRVLRVDLTERTFTIEDIPVEVMNKFIGGKGLAAYYAYREIGEGTQPLSPENRLLIFNGILSGMFPGFTRYVVASKSPATGLFCDSYAGGRFGNELIKTGLMGIIVQGRSSEPVCLRIDGDRPSLEDSTGLRGKNTYDMCESLKPFSAMVIGEAGRNMVRYACILNDLTGPGRAGVCGRGGMGAVMGSKNLDAIAVRGKLTDKELVNPSQAAEVRRIYMKAMEYLRKYVVKGIDLGGNLPAVEMSATAKVLPVRNFTAGYVEGWEKLAIPEIRKYTIKKHTCPLCPLACGVHVKVGQDEVERLEYETVALDGFNCSHIELGRVARLCRRCNELGMDTMSSGMAVSFAMECTEKGVHDFGVRFGDIDGHMELLSKIARREGEGAFLADGIKPAANRLNAGDMALEIKGMEFPGYDPRGVVGMALAYATADRGADHLRAWTIGIELKDPFTIEGKAHLTKFLQDRNAAFWTLISCDNIPSNSTGDPEEWVDLCLEMLKTVGISMTKGDFMSVGERIYNLTRLFNIREGSSRNEDALPSRMFEGRQDTGWKIARADFERLLDAYYKLRGWDSNGVPTNETIRRLELEQ